MRGLVFVCVCLCNCVFVFLCLFLFVFVSCHIMSCRVCGGGRREGGARGYAVVWLCGCVLCGCVVGWLGGWFERIFHVHVCDHKTLHGFLNCLDHGDLSLYHDRNIIKIFVTDVHTTCNVGTLLVTNVLGPSVCTPPS